MGGRKSLRCPAGKAKRGEKSKGKAAGRREKSGLAGRKAGKRAEKGKKNPTDTKYVVH